MTQKSRLVTSVALGSSCRMHEPSAKDLDMEESHVRSVWDRIFNMDVPCSMVVGIARGPNFELGTPLLDFSRNHIWTRRHYARVSNSSLAS